MRCVRAVVHAFVIQAPWFSQLLATIPYSALTDWSRLGNGFFGEVFRCKYLGAEVAVKKTQVVAGDDSLERERQLLGSIDPHPYVIRVMGICDDNPMRQLMLVMEFCRPGSVKNYLTSLRKVRVIMLDSDVRCLTSSCVFIRRPL